MVFIKFLIIWHVHAQVNFNNKKGLQRTDARNKHFQQAKKTFTNKKTNLIRNKANFIKP